jgi:hypothetical protein
MSDRVRYEVCRKERIDLFLEEKLGDAELMAFERHLEACPMCREELEARTAGEVWWSAARDCLAPSGATSSRLDSASGEKAIGEATHSWGQPSAELTGQAQATLAAIKPYLAPTDDPRMMGRVGTYEVVGIVGSGGNGVVLKGFDAALNRYVAIKLLSPRLADSGAARRRFSREAQAAAAVVHDNVMAIHAVAETQGLPYLVMPYVRGPSLEKRLRAGGPLAIEEILRVGMQVAAGLAAAHAQGLVHRDIKPANILLEEGVERVKITDFGLARAADDASLTRSGVISGTPQYMSPEQARGEAVDHRTDLFSLGCLLYAACTGRSPFRAETSYGVLRKICDSEPRLLREVNPAVPSWLAKLIERLLAKEPSRRYPSAAAVSTLLEQCLAHVQQPSSVALPEDLVEPARGGFWRRAVGRVTHRRVVWAPIILLLFAVGLVAWRRQSRPVGQAFQPDGAASQPSAPQPSGSARWDDGIGEQIDGLAADAERLRRECVPDLWHDSVAGRIEQLRSDVDDAETQDSGSEGMSETQSPHHEPIKPANK